MRTSKKQKSVYINYLCNYLMGSLVIALIFILSSMLISIRQYQIQARESNRLKLEEAGAYFDRGIGETHVIAARIIENPHFLVRNLKTPLDVIRAMDDLKQYSLDSDFLEDFILIYDDPAVLHTYSPRNTMQTKTFETGYRFQGITLENFQDYVTELQAPIWKKTAYTGFCSITGQTRQWDVYVYIIPLVRYSANVPAVLVCLIKPEVLAAPFSSLFENMAYEARIDGADNRTIFYAAGSSTLEYKRATQELSVESGRYNLRCTILLQDAAWLPLAGFQAVHIALFVGVLLCGMLISVLLAHRAYLPLKRMMRNITQGEASLLPGANEFVYINHLIEELKRDPPFSLKALLTNSLSTDTAPEALAQLGIDESSTLCMLLLRMESTHRHTESEVQAALKSSIAAKSVILTADLASAREIAVLLAFQHPPERKELIQWMEGYCAQQQESQKTAVIVSRFFQGTADVARCFYQLLYVSCYQMEAPMPILDMEHVSVMQKDYIDMQNYLRCTDLYQQIISGNMEQAQDTLHALLESIDRPGSKSGGAAIVWLSLLSVFRQINDNVLQNRGFEKTLDRLLLEEEPFQGIEQTAGECMDTIAGLMDDKKSRLQAKVVLAFVNSRCIDPNFSLQALADMYHVSPPTMSKFFKKEFGMGLSAYLTDIRLKRACQLLRSTDIPVKQIAAQVGYNDINNFNRRFKALLHQTPTEYRSVRS